MSDTQHPAPGGHDHDAGHGHHGAPQFEIIPENSGVDTFLTYYACAIALVILCIFGGSMLKGHPVEESEAPGSQHESPAH